ncbi:MAG: hypothetical protein JRJ80_21435 [Deltaproteobacteria bacterium]|nr:hypothetical protein [Deltaproteobacteria bacterium]
MNATGYFLPDDWILWHSEGLLEAIKLSSGDHIRIEGTPERDVLNGELRASTWDSLARFEPLLGQLREQLEGQTLQPLTRETVLRGSRNRVAWFRMETALRRAYSEVQRAMCALLR